MNTEQPSQEAMRAVLIVAHAADDAVSAGARRLLFDEFIAECALLIDRELQLPARNAALLLAQTVCDEEARNDHLQDVTGAIDQLRDALNRIK